MHDVREQIKRSMKSFTRITSYVYGEGVKRSDYHDYVSQISKKVLRKEKRKVKKIE